MWCLTSRVGDIFIIMCFGLRVVYSLRIGYSYTCTAPAYFASFYLQHSPGAPQNAVFDFSGCNLAKRAVCHEWQKGTR